MARKIPLLAKISPSQQSHNMISVPAQTGGVDDHPPHLEPSQLGTREYWESFYENSLSHLSWKRRAGRKYGNRDGDGDANGRAKEEEEEEDEEREGECDEGNDSDEDGGEDGEDDDDDSDPGTSWFAEHNAPEKVLRFLTSESFPLAPCSTHNDGNKNNNTQPQPQPQPQPTILDLGTGNGSMLALLRDEGGFTGGQMVGVDYSPKSIELARRLHRGSAGRGRDGEGDGYGGGDRIGADTTTTATSTIRFEVWDVFDKRAVEELDWFPVARGGFDIVLDKGTFDAISLSAEEIAVDVRTVGGPGEKRGEEENVDTKESRVVQRMCERYPEIVRGLEGGGRERRRG
ncbi:conserved hypothetical protein [Histoplasma capsulatum G186AR]|uniref:Methyltransferase domain-containing protein n=1 Tax=Ajellomyces capsulatus (strain G186AR / H82 / ATCC MYA-2454 / RMSCC 2432) TaxID=447093 RepID=C0NUI5_AJECG|nr:uncharacterized protein HCBG_07016 [Histoplasma capsulatum G186AR]EEH05065.1 conserved hypothetical protein [Histoplasma capsulatum G186AR]